MKSTGIVRRTDCNGRISIPMEIRKTLDIPDNTPMELFVEDGRLIYQRYEPEDKGGSRAESGAALCGQVEATKKL